jgi:FHA domain
MGSNLGCQNKSALRAHFRVERLESTQSGSSVMIGGEMRRLVLDCDGVDVITHKLIGDVITIGRAPSNDVVVDDLPVSAQHASLTKSPSGYRLKDLGSTNGTQLNGISITDAELKDGAEIRFGYVAAVFRDAIASIDQGRELRVPGEQGRPAQIRVSGTQSIFVRVHNDAVVAIAARVSNENPPLSIHD